MPSNGKTRLKHLLYLLALVVMASCQKRTIEKPKEIAKTTNSGYRISQIDSTQTYYIIVAEKGNQKFKIVSKKFKPLDREKIKVDSYYDLQLDSIRSCPFYLNGKFYINTSCLVNCEGIDEYTSVCIEPQKGFYGIYNAQDLSGLYY